MAAVEGVGGDGPLDERKLGGFGGEGPAAYGSLYRARVHQLRRRAPHQRALFAALQSVFRLCADMYGTTSVKSPLSPLLASWVD